MDNCLWGYGSEIRIRNERGRKYSDKIYLAESPWQSPEPQSPPFSGNRLDGYTPDAMRSNVTSFDGHPSPVSVCHSPSRSDEEEAENSATTFFSTSSEFCNDTSDVDSSSISARHEFYSFKSVGSSPSDSSSRIHISSNRVGHSVQKGQGGTPRSLNDGQFNQDTMAVLTRSERGHGDPENTDDCGDDLSIFRDQCEKLQKPLDFESNGLIWFPPPPEDEDDDAENNFFTYEDDEDEIGDSGSYCYRNSMASCKFCQTSH